MTCVQPCCFFFFYSSFWRFCRTFSVWPYRIVNWVAESRMTWYVWPYQTCPACASTKTVPERRGRRVRESESAVQTPSFEHKKLPPHCKCNSWPPEEKVGWELPSFCGNKQTGAIKQFPDGNKKKRRRERGREFLEAWEEVSWVRLLPLPHPDPASVIGSPCILKAARQARERPLLMFNQAM